MRGEVEIWDGDKLLHKESNLLVNGAGELLADIMTVSPSLSGIADHATSSILDASNYTIQAISFGKDASAYQNNAHKYGDRRNLWYDSTYSSVGTGNRGISAGTVEGVDYLLSSLPDETNPPGFEDVPSSTAHVTFLGDKKINAPTANISFTYSLNFNAAQDWQPYGPFQASALQDKWFCASVYIKTPHPGYPYNLDLTDPGSNSTAAKLEFKNTITAQGTYQSGYALGRARNSVNIYWDPTTEPHTLSGIHISSFQGDPRTAAAGFTEDEWNANGGVQDVGDGWYRLWNAIPAPSAADYLQINLHPAGYDHGINFGETSGGVYTFGWQLEVGKWPTPLQYNSGYQANAWDLSGSVLNQWYAKYGSEATHPLDKGTVRVVPPYGTSSYTPTNYLSSPPNPESTRVEDRNTTAETFSGIFSSIDFGQNLNMVPWRDYSGMDTQLRTPTSFSAYSVLDSTPPTTTYVKDYAWPFKGNAYNYTGNANSTTSGVGTLGNQAYYLGCYPEGSSTGGSNWALVSSLDNSAAYLQVANGTDPNFVSGTYNSIVNEASSMDAFGFVGKVYDAKNKVGDLPNPNMLGYTVDTALDPGITFNTDLAGTVWRPFAGGHLGTFSSVLHTNPFGGVSSLILSANGTSTGRQALATDGGYDASLPKFRADSAICYSVYVKAHDNPTTSATYFELNVYDKDAPLISYTENFEFINGVPTIDGTPAASSTTTIEDATNGWYRLGITVDGLANTGTLEGDQMIPIFYIGNVSNQTNSDVHNKEIYWYAPQIEQHPLSYGITLPTPYQAVAGLTPTIAEQNGTGGLHVSGGVDATNSGTVEYSMLIGSGDVGYSNLYGGIYNMGLWTIDMDKTLKAGNTPPYSFGPLNNPRKYKLFAMKHLTKNLCRITDLGTNAGSLNYTDLTIKWRLHFL